MSDVSASGAAPDVMAGAAPAASGPDLPEINWRWRRLYSYALTLGLTALILLVIWRLPAGQLRPVCYVLCAMLVLQQLLYMIGPTVEHLRTLVAAVDLRRLIAPFAPPAP